MSPVLRSVTATSKRNWICSACAKQISTRWSSTEAAPPALLSKLKNDLKTAMRAKDAPRLNVLRAVISEVNNASKTSSPVTTDLQILALLKKRKASSQTAQTEARGQNREDLAEKQQAEINVMDEYSSTVKLMTEEDIRSSLSGLVAEMKSKAADTKPGQVLKEVFKTGGVLDGKPVEKSQVAKIVNDLLGGK